MLLKDENTGVEVRLEYDGDGFPIVSISTGGGFYNGDYRPTVEVKLNDVVIHDMFDEEDDRWGKEE